MWALGLAEIPLRSPQVDTDRHNAPLPGVIHKHWAKCYDCSQYGKEYIRKLIPCVEYGNEPVMTRLHELLAIISEQRPRDAQTAPDTQILDKEPRKLQEVGTTLEKQPESFSYIDEGLQVSKDISEKFF